MKQSLLIKSYKELALRKYDYKKLSDLFSNEIEEAILIRLVENTFLDLFSQGSSTSHN